jgi:FtsH-binding integral membrane protein
MEQTIDQEGKREQSRLLARVFGYMAIGLAVTAITSFLVAYGFATWIVKGDSTVAGTTYTVLMIVSGIALFVDTIVMMVMLRKDNHSLWVPYILYTIIMGFFLSSFMLIGVPMEMFAEAFGITALTFLVMFFIGYFSPANLNWLGMIALGLLFSFLFIASFFGIAFLIAGAWKAYWWMELICCVVVSVFVLIVVAVDGYRLKQIAAQGVVSNNYALYMAFNMYTDFISIFIRVLYLLMLAKSKN